MISCIFVLYMAVSGVSLDAPAAPQVPDTLYAQREDLSKARDAAKIWADRLAQDPRDFESAWKLARAQYWLGGHTPEAESRDGRDPGMLSNRS
jgi:hypothetical protein